MTSRKIITLLLTGMIFLFIHAPLIGKKPVIQSKFTNLPIKADGVLDEWPDSFVQDKTGFSYQILNDSVNLYIGLSVKDQAVRNKIRRFGFTLWIDPSGKGKKRLGINYPTKKSADRSRLNQAGMRATNGQNDFEMILLGFNAGKKKFLTTTASNPGIQISYFTDRFNGFSYELVISLEKSGLNFKEYTGDPEKFLRIIFETGYLQTNVQTGGQGMVRGGRSSMGGRGGSGRPGSGGTGNPQQRMAEMQEMTHGTRLMLKQVRLTSGDN